MAAKATVSTNKHTWICDGVDDDTKIQQAIDSLPDSGGVVQLSEGIFSISSTINIVDGKYVWLRGMGSARHRPESTQKGTVLKRAANVDVIEMHVSTPHSRDDTGFMLSDFKIDGDYEDGFFGRGIYIHGDTNTERPEAFTLQNLYITDCGPTTLGTNHDGAGSCLVIDTAGWHRIINCQIGNCWDDVVYVKDAVDFIWGPAFESNSVWDATNLQVKDSVHFASGCLGQIVGGHIQSGQLRGRAGIYVGTDCRLDIVGGTVILFCGSSGILIENNVGGVLISGNKFMNNNRSDTADASHINAIGTTENVCVVGNQFNNRGANYPAKHAFHEEATCNNNLVEANTIFVSSGGVAFTSGVEKNGAGTIVRHNQGHVTENSGTATIASGSTSVTVSHGLGVTPALSDISVTATNNLGSATHFWISNPTSTQFTVNVNADPGASTATFVWKAEVL